MNIVQVVQQSSEWHALRATAHTASEAPAAMGVGKYTTRNELLRQKHNGIEPEAGDKQTMFDRGHAAEAAARSIAEDIVGGDLYPITCTLDVPGLSRPLLASLDGCTLEGDVLAEHKLWSGELAADVRNGTLAPHYTVQMDQQLLVSGAAKCLFMVSDGTRECMEWCWYESSPAKAAALIAAWKQFDADLAAYTPPEPAVVVVAEPMETLPAVSVRIDGQLAIRSNLDAFALALKAYIARIPKAPSTDNEFATCEAACKALKTAEEALDAAETNALASMGDVEAMRRAVANCRDLARATRLAAEKLVKMRKEQIREEEVRRGATELGRHIKALHDRLGGPFIAGSPLNFALAIKGLKTLDSVRNAIDTELARAKIEASALADKIDANLKAIAAANAPTLFPDRVLLVLKAPDDLAAIIDQRLAAQRVADERKAEAVREAERQRIAAETARQQAEAMACEQAAEAERLRALAAPPMNITPAPVAAAPVAPGPTINLGQIVERLGFIVSADFLASLGFTATVERNSRLYAASEFPRICAALAAHCTRVGGTS